MRRYWPFLVLGLVFVLLIGGLISARLWYVNQLKPANPADQAELNFRVAEGMSSEEVARKLEDNDLIKNQLSFRLYLRLQGVSGDVQAGVYRFKPAQSAQEITRALISGEIAARLITITPGMRLSQVVNRLKQQDYSEADINAALTDSYSYSVLADKPPQASLEGYLYPDTYIVDLDTPVVKLID